MRRGDLYWAELGGTVGCEQGGHRPVLIIQNDTGNKHSNTTIVVPITTRTKTSVPTHVRIMCGVNPSIALCEQIRTIDKGRLKGMIGSLSPYEMNAIDIALLISIGIEKDFSANTQWRKVV